MQKKIQLFEEMLLGVCIVGKKICDGEWIAPELSANMCVEKCKELSDYNEQTERPDGNKYRMVRVKAEKEEWFASGSFRKVISHMQLLEKVEGMQYDVELDILETLIAYLWNGIYYEANKLEGVLECAGNLYLVVQKEKGIYKTELDDSMRLLINAITELWKAGISIVIEQGEPEFKQDFECTLVLKIKEMIKQLGGGYVIKQLFDKEINKRYNPKIGRYLISRNKKTFYEGQELESRIPYRYLMQLSLKYLRRDEGILYSEQYKKRKYDELILLSKSYLEVLQLQGYSVLGDIMKTIEEFPYRLSENLCFEKMYIPRQYHPDFIMMLLQNMLKPFYAEGKDKPRMYSFFNYVTVAEYFLEMQMDLQLFIKMC